MHYALADPVFESSLIGYAFLSTPFLNFQARQHGRTDATEFLLAALALVFVVVPSYVIATHYGWSPKAPLTGLNPTLVAFCLLIPFAFIARFYGRAAQRWKLAAEEFLTTLPNALCKWDKAVFLRCAGDEASNWLSLIYVFTWLQVQSYLRVEGYVENVERKRAELRPHSPHAIIQPLAVAIVIYAMASWTAVSALLCSIGFRFGFGADIAKHTLFLQVTAELTPPGKWTILQLVPHKTSGSPKTKAPSLAHSSHAHPDASKILAEWLRDRIANAAA